MKASGARTGGQLAVMESVCPARPNVAEHVHGCQPLAAAVAEWNGSRALPGWAGDPEPRAVP